MPKKEVVKTQISQKGIIFGIISIMHVKDALWISLFYKVFSLTIILNSRRKGGDKNATNDTIH